MSHPASAATATYMHAPTAHMNAQFWYPAAASYPAHGQYSAEGLDGAYMR